MKTFKVETVSSIIIEQLELFTHAARQIDNFRLALLLATLDREARFRIIDHLTAFLIEESIVLNWRVKVAIVRLTCFRARLDRKR